MSKLFFTLAVLLSLTACTSSEISSNNNRSTPVVSPSGTPADATGGVAPPESGDTSPAEFSGAVTPVESKKPSANAVTLKDVRTGRHDSFDRVVFEFTGPALPGYRVEYLNKPAATCGKGDVVEVSGQADLLVTLNPANAHNEQGQATVVDRDRLPNLPMIKQLKLICDFEADVQWVVGVGRSSNFRVVELKEPARLVVDVRH